jgi:hypothetical protein
METSNVLNVISTLMNVIVAVLAAIPCGFGLGVIAAYLLTMGEIGQLPMITAPIGMVSCVLYAILPIGKPAKRRNVLLAGAGGVLLLSLVASLA